MLPIFLAFTLFASTLAVEVIVENPPPDQPADDAEWTMVPDGDGHMHMVHTRTAMSEPVPAFNVDSDVIFELYTPENPREAQIITVGDLPRLLSSNFSARRATRIGVHGWNTDGSLTGTFQQAYFENRRTRHNVNFISVNWQAGSNTLNYLVARRRVEAVSQKLAHLIDFLAHEGGMQTETLVLFGHSLGGHIIGIAGKHVTCGLLPKIIALDPAYPLFAMNRPNERVARGDALSVEIIHTAAGSLGFSAPLGDASFYPNGGRVQPGCGLDLANSCSHSRSTEFYAESINSATGFYSLNCASYEELKEGRCTETGDMVRMGGDMGTHGEANGVYFLETNRRAPFARGNPLRSL